MFSPNLIGERFNTGGYSSVVLGVGKALSSNNDGVSGAYYGNIGSSTILVTISGSSCLNGTFALELRAIFV